jgi:hypothetical protein
MDVWYFTSFTVLISYLQGGGLGRDDPQEKRGEVMVTFISTQNC